MATVPDISLSTLISVASTVIAIAGWYRERTRQALAREREICQIDNTQLKTNQLIVDLGNRLSEIEKQLSRMEILVLREKTDAK